VEVCQARVTKALPSDVVIKHNSYSRSHTLVCMHPREIFETLAKTTWNTLEHAHRHKIRFGEDAFTSIHLSMLASFPSSRIFFEDTRVDEAWKGCDLELWVGRKEGWYRYAIQAKKIDVSESTYKKLNYKSGKSKKSQIDLLKDYADQNRAFPMYLFFNYSKEDFSWNCGLQTDEEQLGCSMTPSFVVRDALTKRGGKKFSFIHDYWLTVPWRCIIDCQCEKKYLLPYLHRIFKEYLYDQLPPEISALRSRSQSERDELPREPSDESTVLRPRWIGIIDLTDQSE
jgi:hypothetical protein